MREKGDLLNIFISRVNKLMNTAASFKIDRVGKLFEKMDGKSPEV
jgi:hypothetical protein